MSKEDRKDYFNYTKPGELIISEIQCERCAHKLKNPLVCEEYPDRKPSFVMRDEGECPKFEEIK